MAQTASVSFPPEFQPLLDKLIQGSLDAFNYPQQQYTGQRVADFAPYQNRAFSAFDALAADPRYGRQFDQARQMLMGSTASPMQRVAAAPVGSREVTRNDITSRMSPYTSEVIDASMADLNKQLERARARTSARQAGIRGRGGPGTELGEGSWTPFLELEEAGLRAGNQLSSSLRNQGYESARNQINTDLGRLLQAGTANQNAGLTAARSNQQAGLQGRALGRQGALDMANLALAQRGMGMQDINTMLGIGGMQQGQNQRGLDAQYQQWQQQQPWGWNRVGNLANVLYGNPMRSTTTEGTASPWSTAGALGTTALGVLGGTGGFGSTSNGVYNPGWLSNAGSWLMRQFGGKDGGYIGYDDGGYVDDDEDQLISGFDALGDIYGESSDDTLLGGEDTLTADYPNAAPVARPSLSSQMPNSGVTAEQIEEARKATLPRNVGSAGFFTDVSGEPTVDNFLTRLGLGWLANIDKDPAQAIGAAGLGAVKGLGEQRREARQLEQLRQKGAFANLQNLSAERRGDRQLQGQALTTEYTTNAAGERADKRIQAEKDKPPPGYIRNADGSLTVDPNWLATQTQLRAAGRPSVTTLVDAKQETERSKDVGKLQAKAISDWRQEASNSRNVLGAIAQMEFAVANGLKTGMGAEFKSDIGRAFIALGVDEDKVNQYFNAPKDAATFRAAANEMVKGLIGSLGTGVSNADRDFIVAMVPQLRDSPQAVEQVIQFMRARAMRNIERFDKGYGAYTKQGKDPLEFEQEWNAQPPPVPPGVKQPMTKEEADALPSGTLMLTPDGRIRRKP